MYPAVANQKTAWCLQLPLWMEWSGSCRWVQELWFWWNLCVVFKWVKIIVRISLDIWNMFKIWFVNLLLIFLVWVFLWLYSNLTIHACLKLRLQVNYSYLCFQTRVHCWTRKNSLFSGEGLDYTTTAGSAHSSWTFHQPQSGCLDSPWHPQLSFPYLHVGNWSPRGTK